MVTHISHSPEQTQDFGEAYGRVARAGEVIALSGDLGAGKTQWVKGLARGLGFEGRVHSPTFTLANVYAGGRLTLFHLDLYRLETPEQIRSAGLEEYLRPAGVTVVEWAERWAELPVGQGRPVDVVNGPLRRVFWVEIETVNEAERRIVYANLGD